jgi:hypothetical protein
VSTIARSSARLVLFAFAALVALGTSLPAAQAQKDEPVARIMYWWGKVNQHVDLATGAWETDPDGVSGADLDMLAYCQRWYPGTRAVEPYARETIATWRERGNVGAHRAEQTSYRCVQ